MDVVERNKKVKKVLSAIFGASNVSVRNGRGTAWGWCEIDIVAGERIEADGFYSQEERNIINTAHDKAEQAIKDIEFYHYSDDMGYDYAEVLIQVNLTNKILVPAYSK
jgi:hypothetical protein